MRNIRKISGIVFSVVALTCLLVFIVGCESQDTTQSLTEQALPTALPEEVGLSSERLQRIKTVMQDYVDQQKLAGLTTVVARRGKIVHFENFGVRNIETGEPIQSDTIFRIYSMSKPITSTAVMMLYEEGHFQLNDPISKFIPEFKNVKVFKRETQTGVELEDPIREITVRDLLTHTAGLTYGFLSDTPVDKIYLEANLFRFDTELKDFVRKLTTLPLLYQPGTQWHYSCSPAVLGYLIEVVSGIPFNQFLDERLFTPLKMNDTSFTLSKDMRNRLAELHEVDENGNLKIVGPAFFRLFAGGNPTLYLGDMGLVSTASDYMRFAQMILNKGELDGVRLLSPKTVELMSMNHLSKGMFVSFTSEGSDPVGWGFGLGFLVLKDVAQSQLIGTEGDLTFDGAANTYFWIDPKEELVGIVMSQYMPYNYYPIFHQLKVLSYQAIVD